MSEHDDSVLDQAFSTTAYEPTLKVWSDQQKAIHQEFADGTGHLVIRAFAGTGKTTHILEGISHAPERRIMLCAFNKRIQEELTRRLQNPNAQAKTLHALGYGCVSRYWEHMRPCAPSYLRARTLTDAVVGDQAPDAMKRLVSTLHTKAREMAPLASSAGDLLDIAYQFDCVPDEEWEVFGYDVGWVEQMALKAMGLAAEKKPIATGIDFADMIFLPVRNRWMRPMYDLVVVDECQDMSAAQLTLAQGLCGGRIVAVGDSFQAIYAFRGADSTSLDRLTTELSAKVLPLSVTYRCGRAIVEEARRFVPDFEASPLNGPGLVTDLPYEKMGAAVQLGDFILSRKNAPLASVAMSLIRAQIRVQVAGKDIGAGLKALVEKLSKAKNSIPAFLDKLVEWESRECVRALKADREEQVQGIQDKGETLRVLCEGVTGVKELTARIDGLFTDDGLGAKGVVTCSSVHKAKGLQANRVFVLKDTLTPFRKRGAKGPAVPTQEERNIEYVACTRAIDELVWVHGLPGDC